MFPAATGHRPTAGQPPSSPTSRRHRAAAGKLFPANPKSFLINRSIHTSYSLAATRAFSLPLLSGCCPTTTNTTIAVTPPPSSPSSSSSFHHHHHHTVITTTTRVRGVSIAPHKGAFGGIAAGVCVWIYS
ncbi:hypothetical protein Tco_1209922 [Tanacetum coccineum]